MSQRERLPRLVLTMLKRLIASKITACEVEWSYPVDYLREVNGQHGFVVREGGRVTQAVAIDLRDGLIAGLYAVRNPDKLRHLN
jgi:hypothetical protein